MQMKKTHDAAMVIIECVYGERLRFNYYIGASQGGREALIVAQRYPADYDGIVADVPILSFSTLMLAPELIRIQEKPKSNWVTRAKVNAIRAEFLRQADKLDGIGGLTTALSLHEAGFAVRVFEAVPEIKPLGVGINILPHALRELEELGLRAPIESAGVACRELAYFTKRGERIWGEPRGLAAGYRWPQISIHRGIL